METITTNITIIYPMHHMGLGITVILLHRIYKANVFQHDVVRQSNCHKWVPTRKLVTAKISCQIYITNKMEASITSQTQESLNSSWTLATICYCYPASVWGCCSLDAGCWDADIQHVGCQPANTKSRAPARFSNSTEVTQVHRPRTFMNYVCIFERLYGACLHVVDHQLTSDSTQ